MSHLKKIICLVVDDEPPALAILKNYIESVASLELAGLCTNALDALTMLQNAPIDLLFLDIQMPLLLGTDLIRTLKYPPKTIFTTAYRKFAVEGFELNAVDYLLKPISFERFLKSVNRVIQAPDEAASKVEEVDAKKQHIEDASLYFRSERKMVKVAIEDILYIESLKDYIKIVTLSKTIVTKQTISSVELTLPKHLFTRIHRSYIVALKKIDAFTPESVDIAQHTLPISTLYRHEVEKNLKG